MPATLPSIIASAASEFAGLRGAAADNAVTHAATAVKSATASTRLAFVTADDSATIADDSAIVTFASSLTVVETAKVRDKALNRLARARVRDIAQETGESLAYALIHESRR